MKAKLAVIYEIDEKRREIMIPKGRMILEHFDEIREELIMH
jgi:hypothetical protein